MYCHFFCDIFIFMLIDCEQSVCYNLFNFSNRCRISCEIPIYEQDDPVKREVRCESGAIPSL